MSRASTRRQSRRVNASRRKSLRFEPLEDRRLLNGEFWLSALRVAGPSARPFDKLEVTFSNPVNLATFDPADISIDRLGVTLHPTITQLDTNRFELDFGGQTELLDYSLAIGPDVADSTGRAMDQNRDGTPGDAYQALLLVTGVTIPQGDTTCDGRSLILYGGTTTINGPHAFADVHILAGATLTHSAATTTEEHHLELVIANSLFIDPTSSIDVSGKGYPSEYTQGNAYDGGARKSAGGSHGGEGTLGSVAGSRTNDVYGDALNPTEPGAGSGDRPWWPGGEGGGVVLISAGQLIVDGTIRADGVPGLSSTGGGGGAGGSVRISAGVLAGIGTISASGGDGSTGAGGDHGSGGGGRVAVFVYDTMTLPIANVTAAGGTGPTGTGGAGSVEFPAQPLFDWDGPLDTVWHGTERLQWTGLGLDPAQTTVRIEAQSGLDHHVIADALPPVAFFDWDMTNVPDGHYEVRATFLDAGGNALHVFRFQNVLVNNSIVWHEGSIRTNEIWAGNQVHAIEKPTTVEGGAILTIEPGAIVKLAPGAGLSVAGAGTLNAPATSVEPIIFTLLTDDSLGGDTNLDGSLSRPYPGQSRGIEVDIEGQANLSEDVQQRYIPSTHTGPIIQDQIWSGHQLHHVIGDVIVESGATLTIEPGAVVKMGDDAGIFVQSGGHLVAPGTVAQPISVTSIHDDTVGGDTGADGNTIAPAPGDWHGIHVSGGQAMLDHVLLAYGGGTTAGTWDSTAGAISTGSAAVVAVSNSIIRNAFFEGILAAGGDVTVSNSIITGADRAVDAQSGAVVRVTHCTLDDNRVGVWGHGGTLEIANTIISNNLVAGIDTIIVSTSLQIRYSNVWSSTGVNYAHHLDQTGIDGNISTDPQYKNRDQANYRLDYRSPLIDAADGARTTDNDLNGAPRYDDPRTPNTGLATTGGAFADMGALEFVESADSDVDLVVSCVTAPFDAVVGGTANVQWVVVNRGNSVVCGPWHDQLALLGNPQSVASALLTEEVLVGQGVTLGPGESISLAAEVTVPPAADGDYHWLVKTNSRGDVFEGCESDNNVQTSLGTTSVLVPDLLLGGLAELAMFDAPGMVRLYKLRPGAGKDVRVTLDLGDDAGVTELYVGREYVPTPQQYDFRHSQFGSADTSVVISSTTDHTYYLAAIAQTVPVTPASYSISAAVVTFGISDVCPTRVGNSGPVTLELIGAGFTSETTFVVRDGAGQQFAASRTLVSDSGHALATFDLGGFSGSATVEARSLEGQVVVATDAVTVIDGGEGRLNASVTAPDSLRAGRSGTWYVTISNDGLVDLPIPLIKFEVAGAVSTYLFDSTVNWSDKVVSLGFNPLQPYTSLHPGEMFTYEYTVTPGSGRTVDAQVSVVSGDIAAADSTPMQWSLLAKPANVIAADWQAEIDGLSDRFGDTLGEYYSVLSDQLSQLASSDLTHEYTANLNGQWVLGPEPSGIPTAPDPQQANPQPPLPQGQPSAPKTDGLRKTYFVVICDADYGGTNDLPPVANDYTDLRQYLGCVVGAPDSQIRWLYDAVGSQDDANNLLTRQRVVDAIKSFKGKIDADDNLFIIYSGHGSIDGQGNGYLCLHGGDVSAAELRAPINEVAPGTVYVVNSSCRSQALTEAINPSCPIVGISSSAETQNTVSYNSGNLLLSQLKTNLGLCYGLGEAFDRADQTVKNFVTNNRNRARSVEGRLGFYGSNIDWKNPKYWMDPQLYNPDDVDLSGKPWEDPTGYKQQLKQVYRAMKGTEADSSKTWVYGSWDPNDKIGPAGYGPEKFIQADELHPYTVHFENLATATAPAQEVVVTDTLDADLDWSTFELTGIGFNDVVISDIPAGLQQYTTQVTVSSDPNPVDITVSFDTQTGTITWRMRSTDPVTGGLPEDPIAGFLPPNDDTGRGEGYVSFTVRPLAGLPTGTQITNQATIVFDPEYQVNPPIDTPEVLNTLDADPPTSQVGDLLPVSVPDFTVTWSGSDDTGGSGIAYCDVYVATDAGDWELWKEATTDVSGVFSGLVGHEYAFCCVATDNVGHREPAALVADAVTTVAVTDLGTVDFTQLLGLNPGDGDLWFQLATTRAGSLTVIAAPAAGATVALYDTSQTEPPLAVADGATGRLDHSVQAGQTCLLKVSGDPSDVQLTIANLVATTDTEIQVFGTDAADTFAFAPTGSYTITINGVPYDFDDTQYETIVFDGGEGDDSATLTGGTEKEVARLYPDHGTFGENGFLVTVSDVVGITAHAGGGSDEAYLYDSAGDDTFVSHKGYSKLSGEGFSLETFDFTYNYGYATTQNGGSDVAIMEDTPGADKFKFDWPASNQFFGKMYGGGAYYNRAKNFEQIEAVMTDGKDTVCLFDSEGDDTFYGQKDQSRLTGSGYDVTVSGYNSLTAYASIGADIAHLEDSTDDDTTRARSHKIVIWGGADADPTYTLTARRFDEYHFEAKNGGYDRAKLHDTAVSDYAHTVGDTASLSRNDGQLDLLYEAIAFEWVRLYATDNESHDTLKKEEPLEFDLVYDSVLWEELE